MASARGAREVVFIDEARGRARGTEAMFENRRIRGRERSARILER